MAKLKPGQIRDTHLTARGKWQGEIGKKYQRRQPSQVRAAKAIRYQYEIIPVSGTATGANRLTRIWFSDNTDILPHRAVPEYGIKKEGDIVAPILFHTEILCQHPGSMAKCQEKAEESVGYWLEHGDPLMLASDVMAIRRGRQWTGEVAIEIGSGASDPVLGSEDDQAIRAIRNLSGAGDRWNGRV